MSRWGRVGLNIVYSNSIHYYYNSSKFREVKVLLHNIGVIILLVHTKLWDNLIVVW